MTARELDPEWPQLGVSLGELLEGWPHLDPVPSGAPSGERELSLTNAYIIHTCTRCSPCSHVALSIVAVTMIRRQSASSSASQMTRSTWLLVPLSGFALCDRLRIGYSGACPLCCGCVRELDGYEEYYDEAGNTLQYECTCLCKRMPAYEQGYAEGRCAV